VKISILTACRNKISFIKKCVQSVSAQQYNAWEHIIVDDCSTDGSFEYLSSITDPRVTVVRNDDRKYCSSSYAKILMLATGEICGILDGDDVLDPTAMNIIHKKYVNNPHIDYIYTQHNWCDKSLLVRRKGLSSAPKQGKSLAQSCLDGRHCFSHWRTFRTKLREKGIMFPEGLEVSVDKNMGFALEEMGRGAFLPKSLYYYRYYKGNMSLVQGRRQKADTLNMASKHIANRKQHNIMVYPVITIK